MSPSDPPAHINGTAHINGDGGGRGATGTGSGTGTGTALAASLEAIFEHMGVAIPAANSPEWRRMVELEPQNVWRRSRPPMRQDTATILRRFYGPFNAALALLQVGCCNFTRKSEILAVIFNLSDD
jgi:hypothetical protein